MCQQMAATMARLNFSWHDLKNNDFKYTHYYRIGVLD